MDVCGISNRNPHSSISVTVNEFSFCKFSINILQKSTVNLTSVPIEYMEPIIDFLYSNDTQLFKSQNCSDNYLYNMIIICDQYFINQLRNVFELMLIERLTIRKCSDMLEFANEYNCKLLKKCSLDFIVQNMARVLEQRILEDLDGQLLKEIGELYRKEFKIKEYSYDFPIGLRLGDDGQLGDVLLESFVEDFTVDLNYKCENKSNVKAKESKKIRNNTQDRRSYEKEAKEAIKNLSIELNDTISKKVNPSPSNPLSTEATRIADELHSKVNWTKVSEKKSAKKKISLPSPRLNEVLQNEEKEKENFVSLSKKSPTSPIDIPQAATQNDSDDSSVSLRSSFSLGNFTPTKRMTQKQRKSFPLLGTSIDETAPSDKVENNSLTENAWGIKSPKQAASKTSPITTPTTAATNASFFQSPPQASTSFLGKQLTKSKSSPCETDCFSKILHEERKEREYYEKLKSKSLILTQVEETAISELQAFYNVDNVYDEAIRVERASHITPTMNFAVWRR